VAESGVVVLPLFRASIRNTNLAYQDNLARLNVAARLADQLDAPLVLAEGWKSNDLGDGNIVDGTDAACILLKQMNLPQSAALVPLHRSCCTWQELAEVHERFPDRAMIVITGAACPSVRRAQRVCRLQQLDAQVFSPLDACVRYGIEPPPHAKPHRLQDGVQESINWIVHGLSCLERRWSDPLEFRLARRLRQGTSARTR
jgi:hypothetical protein